MTKILHQKLALFFFCIIFIFCFKNLSAQQTFFSGAIFSHFSVSNYTTPNNKLTSNLDCPTLGEPTASIDAVCDGDFIELNIAVTEDNGGSLLWINANTGTPVDNPDKVFLYADNCSIVTYNFYAQYTAADDCGILISNTISITVYPSTIEANVQTSNCAVDLIHNCNDFAVAWQDNLGNSGTGTHYEANDNESGSVVFTLYDPNNTNTLICSTANFQANFTCTPCYANAGTVSSIEPTNCVIGNLVVQNTSSSPSDYSYYYLVVNSSNNVVGVFDTPNLDFLNLPSGNYCIYGISAPINSLSTGVNTLDEFMLANKGCYEISPCFEITKAETIDLLMTTNPYCNNDGTFNVGFTVTGGSGSYEVYEETMPTTLTAYQNQEIIINFSSGQHTVFVTDPEAPLCIAPSVAVFSQTCSDSPCPVTNTQTQGTLINVCDGEVMDLTQIFDDAPENLSWSIYQGTGIPEAFNDGPAVPNPQQVVVNSNGCEMGDFSYTAHYEVTEGICTFYQILQVKAFVFPVVTLADVQTTDCEVSLSVQCPGTNIVWTDSFGNSGEGLSYTPNQGTNGTVSFTIESGNVNGVGCDALTHTESFSCGVDESCPYFTNILASSSEICDGDPIAFQANLANEDGGSITWYRADNNTPIANPSNYLVQADVCEASTLSFYAVYQPTNNSCNTVQSDFLAILVHPIFNPVVEESNCFVNLIPNCPNFSVYWNDDMSNSGQGTSYTAAPSTAGTVTFSAYDASNGNAPCLADNNYSINFNCNTAICPTIESVSANFTESCAGFAIALSAEITNYDGGTIKWYRAADNTLVPNPEMVLLENDLCESAYQGFYITYEPTGLNCNFMQSTFVNVLVHPPFNPTIQATNCSISLIPNCESFTGFWTDELGNTGTGFNYVATPGTSGEVTFNLNDNSGSVCADATVFVLDFNCPADDNNTNNGGNNGGNNETDCPTVTQPEPITMDVCSGDAFSLYWVNAEVDWYDLESNEMLATPYNITLSTTTPDCSASYYDYYAIIDNATPECGAATNIIQRVSVAVYPDLTANIIQNNSCSVSISQNCNSFIAAWQDDAGNAGVGFTYNAPPTANGVVTFLLTNSIVSCDPLFIEVPYNCEAPEDSCPLIYNATSSVNEVCNGFAFSLQANVYNDDGGTLTWYDTDDNLVLNPALVILDVATCEPEMVSFYAVYQPTSGLCAEVYSDRVEVVVLPTFAPTITPAADGCQVNLVANCDNFIITWEDSNGNSGTGNVFNAEDGTTGTVHFSASLAELTSSSCLNDLSFPVNYNCSAGEIEPPIVETNCVAEVAAVITTNISSACNIAEVSFEASGTFATGMAYTYVLVDANSNIVGINPTATFNLIQINGGDYCLYGLSYSNTTPTAINFEVLTLTALLNQPNTCTAVSDCTPVKIADCETINVEGSHNESTLISFDAVSTGISAMPDFGSISVSANGNVIYMPDEDFVGTDVFAINYTSADGIPHQVTVVITVPEANNTSNPTDVCDTTPPNGTVSELCTTPMTPLQICVDASDFALAGQISDVHSLFECSLNILSDNCIQYMPLPGMENVPTPDELLITYCAIDCPEVCFTDTFFITTQEAPCETSEPICDFPNVDLCVETGETTDICIFCDDTQDIIVTNITSSDDSSLTEITGSCFSITPFIETDAIDTLYVNYCLATDLSNCNQTYLILNVGGCSPNQAPIANDDTAYSNGDAISFNPSNNDYDPDGDDFSFLSFTMPNNGFVSYEGGLITYTPDSGFSGTDTFLYQVCDTYDNCAWATINIIVNAATCLSTEYACVDPIEPYMICPEFCDLPAADGWIITDVNTLYPCSIYFPPESPTCVQYTALPLFEGVDTITIVGCNPFGVCDTAYVIMQVTGCDEEEDSTPNTGLAIGEQTAYKLNNKLAENPPEPLSNLSVYPSPVSNQAQVKWQADAARRSHLSLYSITGQLVHQQQIDGLAGHNYANINLEKELPGIYLLMLNDGQTTRIQKLVKN